MIWKTTLALIAIVVLGLPVLQSKAEENELSVTAKPLKDLGSIAVLVEDLGPDGVKAGISKEKLKASVELRLRQNGLAVREVKQTTLESPWLYINTNILYVENGDFFIYKISIALNQTVRLLRNDTMVRADTWEKGYLGISPPDNISEKVEKNVDTLLTFFLNDYLAANPKAEK